MLVFFLVWTSPSSAVCLTGGLAGEVAQPLSQINDSQLTTR